MSEESHTEEHGDEHHEHFIVPAKFYWMNAVVITVLMLMTVGAAKIEMFDFGHINGLNLWIAIAIAAAKTFFIGAIFMGVWWNSPLVKVFATCAVVWLMIMFSFMMVDYASPKWGLGTPYRDFEQPGAPALPGAAPAQEIVDMSGFGHHGDDEGGHAAAGDHDSDDEGHESEDDHH